MKLLSALNATFVTTAVAFTLSFPKAVYHYFTHSTISDCNDLKKEDFTQCIEHGENTAFYSSISSAALIGIGDLYLLEFLI